MKKISFILTVVVLLCTLIGCTQVLSPDASGNDTSDIQSYSIADAVTDACNSNNTPNGSDTNNANDAQNIPDNDTNNINSTNDAEDITGAHVLSINTDDFSADLIVYLKYDAQGISDSNASNSILSLSRDELFKVTGRFNWWSQPESLSGKLLVLPNDGNELVGEPTIRYTVTNEFELYFDEYTLVYYSESNQAIITKSKKAFAELDLVSDGTRFSPHAFFVDDEDKIALWCNTKGEGYSDAGVHPVSMIYARSDEAYQLETINDHASIFDDFDLSIIMMPSLSYQDKAIQSSAQDKAFLWNESQKIVKVNPYDGSVVVMLDENRIKADIPFLDTTRESYDFFTGVGCQNGVYLAMFPNYNNLASTFVVFYNDKGEFLGNVLCTEDKITISNRDNVEIGRIENIALEPLLYIPQEKMN